MSQAFVREGDDQSLEDVGPSLRALIVFLMRENNGIGVREINQTTDATGHILYQMSNGLSYAKDMKGKWQVIS
jgi:hypothetical protein